MSENPQDPPAFTTHPLPEASFAPANRWAIEGGEEYVVIDNLQDFDPFFLNIVGTGDQWLFCSSHGSLSAGRRSPDSALFPYYTVDKITDNWNCTGPWTALVCDGKLWNPFRPSIALLSPTRRRLMKSVLGDEIVFDETHSELELRFTYRWQFSERYGFVRKAKLTNEGTRTREVRLADGIENFLPPGIDSRMQLQYSCLADAYKTSELLCGGSLMIHRLASGIVDAPIPLECLKATTVWATGLGDGPTYMVRGDAEGYLRGRTPVAEDRVRARRGGFYLARELSLAAGESVEWTMVAEIDQTHADVTALNQAVGEPEKLLSHLQKDLLEGRSQLRDLVEFSDGFQKTADRDTALYHYQNTLCNIMRGGLPENGYALKPGQFASYLTAHNSLLAERCKKWLADLPETLERDGLIERAKGSGDADLLRLAEEYLPLILSRRHGDPSRPWNRFDIRLKDESGDVLHHFEGNWRDIFQNWEALALSYPDFLGGFIAKFLNASTIDGYNPYRITSGGVDWEAPDPEDPWISIGYWGDHQIVYLLKLLELEAKIHPDALSDRLDTPCYVFADVPYRLKSWQAILDDPRDTIAFDSLREKHLKELKARMGADGLLLRDGEGQLVKVTLAEKLLLPALVKLANLVPGGGIWLNTQKPEWNDANNALAGSGLSVVTTGYLHRYVSAIEELVGNYPADSLQFTSALAGLMDSLGELFTDPRWNQSEELTGDARFKLVKAAGLAAEKHRDQVYGPDPGKKVSVDREVILTFLRTAREVLVKVLQQNQREDGLWHSYNILETSPTKDSMGVGRLSLMLEGQVSILSAGILTHRQSLNLLESLAKSDLRSSRHPTYLLYPDRELASFLEINKISEDAVRQVPALAEMVDHKDFRIVVEDEDCGFRFHPSITNHYTLRTELDEIGITQDREAIEALYESVFNHQSFTGRSGSMFGYEGLGCVYWHMVSKLMVAAQEVALAAGEIGAPTFRGLAAAYYSVQRGLGYRQSPESYGAFPAEPYSHSPGQAGAQQPGLTGQVKEGLLCRAGELGVAYENGRLSFRPSLLRAAEFEGLPAGPGREALEEGVISFFVSRVPVTYHRVEGTEEAHATIHLDDDSKEDVPGALLDPELTSEIIRGTGKVTGIEVDIPRHWLIA